MVHIARDVSKQAAKKAREAVAGSSTPILTEEQLRQRQIEKDSQIRPQLDKVISAHPSTNANAINRPHGPSDTWAEQHRERRDANDDAQVPKNSEVSEEVGGKTGGKPKDVHPVVLVPAAKGPADETGEIMTEDRSSHIAPNGPETLLEDYKPGGPQLSGEKDESQPTDPKEAADFDPEATPEADIEAEVAAEKDDKPADDEFVEEDTAVDPDAPKDDAGL